MKKINVAAIKHINWKRTVSNNRYTFISLLILAFYFYATFSAVSFIVKNIRTAFRIDDAAKSQVVHFNLADYEKISKRIGVEGKK